MNNTHLLKILICWQSTLTYRFMWFQIFSANTDSHSLRHLYLDEPITARFVRIHVMEWHGHPSLRIELIGCQGKHNTRTPKCLTSFDAVASRLSLSDPDVILKDIGYHRVNIVFQNPISWIFSCSRVSSADQCASARQGDGLQLTKMEKEALLPTGRWSHIQQFSLVFQT